jgi:hypothetical protein
MKTTWLIGCVCKRCEAFSLAVLIDRGLDQETGLKNQSRNIVGDADRVFMNRFLRFSPRYLFIQFSGYCY